MENQGKTLNWRNEIIGVLIGTLSSVAVFSVILPFCVGFIAWLSDISPYIGILGFVLLCGIFLFCASIVGDYAEVSFAEPAGGSLTDAGPRPGVVSLVIIHAIPFAIVLLLLWFVVPVFMEMYAQFGRVLPVPTQLVSDISVCVRRYWFFVVPGAAALLWGDIRVYKRLHRRSNRTGALIWFWGIYCFPVAMAPFMVWAGFQPIFGM